MRRGHSRRFDARRERRPLWTLFTLRGGCAGADSRPYKKRQRPNSRTHAHKTRVQTKTRPALIYGRAGRAVLRCYQLAQSETCLTLISGGRTAAGQAGRVSLRGSKWKRHRRLSGLSLRCGGRSAFNAALALVLRSEMRLCCRVCLWFTPAVCLATNRTACDSLRSYSAGSRSPFARSRGVGAVICLCGFTSGLCVSLWRSRRGYRGYGERRTGSAARPLCAFAQPHWL